MEIKQKNIPLPKPLDPGGKTVYQALYERQTIRTLSTQNLDQQQMSNVLWAAKGVNRKNGAFGVAGLTAASASNSQEVDVSRSGLFRRSRCQVAHGRSSAGGDVELSYIIDIVNPG